MIKSKFLAVRYAYRRFIWRTRIPFSSKLRDDITRGTLNLKRTWSARRPSFRRRRCRSAYRRVKPQTSRQTKIADKSAPVDDYWRSGTYPGGQRRTKCTFISGTGRRTCKESSAVRTGVGARSSRWFLTPNLIVALRDKLHRPDIHRLRAT